MPNDIVIEVWHHGGHWSLKKSGDQYWYKSTNGTELKAGLPPGMKALRMRHGSFAEDRKRDGQF
jgi:hypothetical protein